MDKVGGGPGGAANPGCVLGGGGPGKPDSVLAGGVKAGEPFPKPATFRAARIAR